MTNNTPTPPTPTEEINPYSPSGRIGRLRYMAYLFNFNLAVFIFVAILAITVGEASLLSSDQKKLALDVFTGMVIISYLIVFILFVIWTIKRLHDCNMSGWFSLVFVLPVINFILWFIPGVNDDNRFGKSPPPNPLSVKITGLLFPAFFLLAGIVVFTALTQYLSYKARVQVFNSLSLAWRIQGRLEIYYLENNRHASTFSDLGLPYKMSDRGVSQVQFVNPNKFIVTLDGSVPQIRFQTLEFIKKNGQWECVNGSLKAAYRPKSCKITSPE
jgi:uncharacterized membrane protein YhaH (DUF805 family)